VFKIGLNVVYNETYQWPSEYILLLQSVMSYGYVKYNGLTE
jgi:hypothetical protein